MPRFSDRFLPPTPKYRQHRASGQAVVTLYGKDFYLGPYGSKTSRDEYNRLIGEWMAAGRLSIAPAKVSDIAIVEVAVAYRRHAKQYYQKHGRPTDTFYQVKRATEILCSRYGRTAAADFGPLAFQAVQVAMIEQGLARSTINHFASCIRRMFRWAASQELVPASVYQGLTTVPGLSKGRTKAREAPPVRPVEDYIVEATLPFLPRTVADMVRLQRLTGCRPGEVCIMRPRDIDTTEDVWSYRPAEFKVEHHDLDRVVFVGPEAQQVLRPYLTRDQDAFCFNPRESEQHRNTIRRQNRQSAMTPSQANRQPNQNRRCPPGRCYNVDSYRRAVTRGIEKANRDRTEKDEPLLPHWFPNQLRHTAGTQLRKKYGTEAARTVLGHTRLNTTETYAERDTALARKVMGEVG